jgi:hypothetical protein
VPDPSLHPSASSLTTIRLEGDAGAEDWELAGKEFRNAESMGLAPYGYALVAARKPCSLDLE